MNCLLLADSGSDFSRVLESCGAAVTRMTLKEAVGADLSPFDAFVVSACGKVLDARLRAALEAEAAKGKRLFTEALNSWDGIYSAEPADDTRRRLIVTKEADGLIPGLVPGDLLDDNANRYLRPWYGVPGMKTLLVCREHIIAHRRLSDPGESRDGDPALWTVGENVMMCAFELHDFNRARFAPRAAWRSLIGFLAEWITGSRPAAFPGPIVRYGTGEDLSDGAVFEKYRKETIDRGIARLKGFLIDEGRGGIREGLRHNIDPNGVQAAADTVRTDCCGEAAGAFGLYGALYHDEDSLRIAEDLSGFVFGPMQVRGGDFDGMLRWTETAWEVCYQDDAARALLPALYRCLFLGDDRRFPAICRALDFLVKTTAKDGCRVPRTDKPALTEAGPAQLAGAEHGLPSAHYNAYYHAALLLAYQVGGNERYLDTARRGLETIMALYPDTRREQSETEELCRLILPLAALYGVTKEEKHLAMLRRVTDDLETHRHPSGGYREWDTGYKAKCSRESDGECSLLTENGDPVADLLYSVNWLPVGFAWAYHVTGDARYRDLWRNIAAFFIKTQARSDDPVLDGLWCRAFDMELGEPYGCPHDVGWAAHCSETGWTDAEILMGLMLPELLDRGPFINYAHRGASAYAPENTMAAFRLGVALGANGVETDIRRTKDGVPVLFHDETLLRLTGVDKRVADLTYDELSEIRISSPDGASSDTVPTLTQFLAFVKENPVLKPRRSGRSAPSG